MPPVVHGEEVVPGPGVGVAAHPRDPVLATALHLHAVGDRVPGPGVPGLQLDRAPPGRLGAGIEPGLLQTEGVHAEHRVVTGHAAGPVRQGTGDAVADHPRVPRVEVHEMTRLERQGVPRILHGDVLQHPAGGAPLVAEEVRECAQVGALTGVGRHGAGRFVARLGDREAGGLGAQQIQIAMEHMAHDERGVPVQGRADGRDRVAAVALKLLQCLLVGPDQIGAGGGDGVAEVVLAGAGDVAHGCLSSSVSRPERSGLRKRLGGTASRDPSRRREKDVKNGPDRVGSARIAILGHCAATDAGAAPDRNAGRRHSADRTILSGALPGRG